MPNPEAPARDRCRCGRDKPATRKQCPSCQWGRMESRSGLTREQRIERDIWLWLNRIEEGRLTRDW